MSLRMLTLSFVLGLSAPLAIAADGGAQATAPSPSNTICPVTGLPVVATAGTATVTSDSGEQVVIACATADAAAHIAAASDEVKSWYAAAAKANKVVDEKAGRLVDPAGQP